LFFNNPIYSIYVSQGSAATQHVATPFKMW